MEILTVLTWSVVFVALAGLTVLSAKKALEKHNDLKLHKTRAKMEALAKAVEAPVAQLIKSGNELKDKGADALKSAADKLMAAHPLPQKVRVTKPKAKPKKKK